MASVWSGFIVCMILYFILSTVEALGVAHMKDVKRKHKTVAEKAKKALKKKTK